MTNDDAADPVITPADGAPRSGSTPPAARPMGTFMATCLVTGNMIGSGVFFLPRALSAFGWIAILAWIVTGAGSMLLALTFARLGSAYPSTGGPYIYVRHAFGDSAGFIVAWGYWLTVVVSNAAVSVAAVDFLSYFFDGLADNTAVRLATNLAIIWGLTAIAARGVHSSGAMAVITTVLKLIPLLAVTIVGLMVADLSALEFNPSGEPPLTALGAAAALTLFAFIGLESATIPAGELQPPAGRTLAVSTITGTAIAVVVYIFGTLAVFGQLTPAELSVSANPFGDAAESIFGSTGGSIIAAGAVISALGTLNGFILLQGHMPLAAARDGLFPNWFRNENTRGVPMFGLIASSVIASVCVFVAELSEDGFDTLVLVTTVTALLPYLMSAAAQLLLMVTDRDAFNPVALISDGVIAGLAFAYSAWTIWGSGAESVRYSAMLLIAGVPLLIIMRWQQARDGKVSDAAAL
ncbi:amino acid permease [Ilumatobacter sp.]|uniref:amino acid permease n=1 Tax=Ilumatobacter sp. TaxID=1967498 RepID=UPI003C3CE781